MNTLCRQQALSRDDSLVQLPSTQRTLRLKQSNSEATPTDGRLAKHYKQ